MTSAIQRVGAGLLVAFFVISLSLVYWQVIRAPALLSDPEFNARRSGLAAQHMGRGRILDRNGEVLAEMVSDGTTARRVYPYPALVHVVGYSDVRYGTSGLEAAYDDFLRGDRTVDPIRGLLRALIGGQALGSDIVTTIDLVLQHAAEDAFGEGSGAAIVFDPRNGDVLALVSHPYFDPNTLADDFETLQGDQTSPLLNRATLGLYPPGSTFKLVTMSAAVDSDLLAPNTMFHDPTHGIAVEGFFIGDPNHPGIDSFDALHALAYSSNSAFAQVGLDLGRDRLLDYARRFGFGTSPPFDLPVSESLVTQDPDYLGSQLNLAVTSIGQGEILATPYQLGLVAGTIANGGVQPRPRLVRVVRSPGGIEVEPPPVALSGPVISAGAADVVRQGMELAVTEGGVATVALPGVRVAAKSGTAEVSMDNPHAWVVAFAPADQPRVVVVVIKENAGGGSTHAGPVARQLLVVALERLAEGTP